MGNMEQIDPFCDPQNPRVVDFESISTAYFKIKDGIICSPCVKSHMFEHTGIDLYFKKDYMQKTGSFKDRGARFALIGLVDDQKTKGVITACVGNHALGLSYQGGQLGIPVTVVMPKIAPIMKIENCKKYGAQVIIHGENLTESKERALQLSKRHGSIYINGYDHPHIIAGAGTMGLEILEQIPDLEAVVVPVGGGGLIAGVAKAIKTLKPNIIIIGVEPERAPSFSNAMKYGKPVDTDCQNSLAEGLVISKVGVNSYVTAAPLIDKIVTVNEESIALSMLRIVELEKAVVEGSGAVGVAAVLSGLLPELKGKRVVIPLCGSNVDTSIFGRCLERGLAADGRLVKFTVTVTDCPGGVAELVDLLRDEGVTIKDILHDRVWVHNDIFSVEIKVVAETRSRAHTKNMFDALNSRYGSVDKIESKVNDSLATNPSKNSKPQGSQFKEEHQASSDKDSMKKSVHLNDEGISTMVSRDKHLRKDIQSHSTFMNTDYTRSSSEKINYESEEDEYSESHKSHSSNRQLTNSKDLIGTPSYFGSDISIDDSISELKDFNEHSTQSMKSEHKVRYIEDTFSHPGFSSENKEDVNSISKDNKTSSSWSSTNKDTHTERKSKSLNPNDRPESLCGVNIKRNERENNGRNRRDSTTEIGDIKLTLDGPILHKRNDDPCASNLSNIKTDGHRTSSKYNNKDPTFGVENSSKIKSQGVAKRYIKHDESIISMTSYQMLTEVYNSGTEEIDDKNSTSATPPTKSTYRRSKKNMSKLSRIGSSELKDSPIVIEDRSLPMNKKVEMIGIYSNDAMSSSSTIFDDDDNGKLKDKKFSREREYSENDDSLSNLSTPTDSSSTTTTMGDIKYMFDKPFFGIQPYDPGSSSSSKGQISESQLNYKDSTYNLESEEHSKDNFVEDVNVEHEDDENSQPSDNSPIDFMEDTQKDYALDNDITHGQSSTKAITFKHETNSSSLDLSSRSITKDKKVDSEFEILDTPDDGIKKEFSRNVQKLSKDGNLSDNVYSENHDKFNKSAIVTPSTTSNEKTGSDKTHIDHCSTDDDDDDGEGYDTSPDEGRNKRSTICKDFFQSIGVTPALDDTTIEINQSSSSSESGS